MLKEGFITEEERNKAAEQRIWSSSYGRPPRAATIVHPPLQGSAKYPYFIDYVRRYLENKLGRDAVYRGGLEIHTTLDPKIQADAEKAVSGALLGTLPPLEMALAAVDPNTGHVKALVGGRDFGASGGQVNLALGRCTSPPERLRSKVDVEATCWKPPKGQVPVDGGGTGRQPGSAWKPIVLAAALEKGISDTKVYSAPSSYRIPGCRGDLGCVIRNYEGSGGGRASLRQGTVKSYNTVYAQVIRDVGVPEAAEMAKKLGITSAWVANPEVHGPSYALGAQEVAPLEMASAYGVFATNGMRAAPTPVEWITTRSGRTVEDNRRPRLERVLSESVAYNVTDILKGVITGGTGTRADIGRPAAGKTGTAQEWRDAWFIGYTPQLSAAVWIGNKDRPTTLSNIKGLEHVFGGSIPAETWKAFMLEALKDVPPQDFVAPASYYVPPPTYTPPSVRVPRETTTTADPYATTTTAYVPDYTTPTYAPPGYTPPPTYTPPTTFQPYQPYNPNPPADDTPSGGLLFG
ncbi:MAG TPA: penicillin-binding transpeptidase domain-containing protein [Acidimicrobiales bacterium]|nr:penicillin-binding transpeptidase domain-containing protein [Acidimicrobiales bacterium]